MELQTEYANASSELPQVAFRTESYNFNTFPIQKFARLKIQIKDFIL